MNTVSADVPDVAAVARIADALLRYPFRPWFYGDSIGIEGLCAAGRMLDDDRYAAFCIGLARGALARDTALRPMDNTVPGGALTRLATDHDDSVLLELLVRLRSCLGGRRRYRGVPVSLEVAGLVHPFGGASLPPSEVALLDNPGAAVYVDCLHFDPTFDVALGRAVGDERLVESGLDTACAFVELLQDDDSGLFYHFALEATQSRYILGWSRGQGWAALGLIDVIETVGLTDERTAPLRAALVKALTAMASHQREDGHWGALTEPTSPPEHSAAAFMAAAMLRAHRLGLASDSLAAAGVKALRAALAATDDSGVLRGVSAAVWSSTSREHYNNVSIGSLYPWGQGPLLLALEEQQRVGRLSS